jgi:hypothetical protein
MAIIFHPHDLKRQIRRNAGGDSRARNTGQTKIRRRPIQRLCAAGHMTRQLGNSVTKTAKGAIVVTAYIGRANLNDTSPLRANAGDPTGCSATVNGDHGGKDWMRIWQVHDHTYTHPPPSCKYQNQSNILQNQT